MRYITCARCGKRIYEGKEAVRHKHYTGFWCSWKCFVLDYSGYETAITDKLVQEDKSCNNVDWELE